MIALTLVLFLNSTQDSWVFRCDTCGKDVPEDETEIIGHKHNAAHAHPQPCRYRVHTDCLHPVRCEECSKAEALCSRCSKDYRWTPLEVLKTSLGQDKIKDLVSYVGTKEDGPSRLAAHADQNEKAIQALAPLKVGDDLQCYLLWGPSGCGLDAKRRAVVAAAIDEKAKTLQIRVVYARYVTIEGFGGTADVVYVGFQAVLGRIEKGEWKVQIYERTDTYQNPDDKKPARGTFKLGREFTFRVNPT